MKILQTQGVEIMIFQQTDSDYMSLTDMARYQNPDEPKDVVKNWMRTKSTIEFLSIWEKINNPNFKGVEFDPFKNQPGDNAFVLSPQKWINTTNAIGIVSKSGRYGGGTFAHKDIAFEFAAWISPEFKLYLIKEFQRLKEEENERLSTGWDFKRMLTKINYHIQTDAIRIHLIPLQLTREQINAVYSTEADILNKALFGMTAQEWQNRNPKQIGNIRDDANIAQLICLANLESFNAELIRRKISQQARLKQLNEIAIIQMRSLVDNPTVKRLNE